jgi:lambda family phage minor tail protein L
MTVPISELQSASPSAIIELFELQLVTAIHGTGTLTRYHAGVDGLAANGNIVWAGNTYQAYPIEAEGFEYSVTITKNPRKNIDNRINDTNTYYVYGC